MNSSNYKSILTEEFNRQKMSDIKDKLLYDISQINKGIYLNPTEKQTDYMKEILSANFLVQELRKRNILNSEVKILEKEWEDIYKLVKEYDIAVKKFNASHSKKIKNFVERVGGMIVEHFSEYFPY